MTKGIIYYTDNRVENAIRQVVERHLYDAYLPIISASLKPIPFGDNEVIVGERGYPTMVKQIVSCLERSTADVVFFCEHDVLYPKSYFTFEPISKDTFYYNTNNWRWEYPKDRLIRYDGLTSLSQLCVWREMALDHFQGRSRAIQSLPATELKGKDPSIFREWGYEPGLKKTRNGGYSNEKSEFWSSKHPTIDIRHDKTYSPPKTHRSQFKHAPQGWLEAKLDDIYGWHLREEFNLWN